MDLIAVTLNIIIAVLAFWIAKLGIEVGRATGNLNWFVIFTIGWIVVGISRIFTAITYTDFLSEPKYRNLSSFMVVIALIMMLYGMFGFSNTIFSRVKKHV